MPLKSNINLVSIYFILKINSKLETFELLLFALLFFYIMYTIHKLVLVILLLLKVLKIIHSCEYVYGIKFLF